MDLVEVITADEAENVVANVPSGRPEDPFGRPKLPSTSLTSVSDPSIYAQLVGQPVAGWIYFNLDQPHDTTATQAWVTVSMRAEGLFSVDLDAIALGNGCSAPVLPSEVGTGNATIGPLPNVRSPQ